MHKHVNRLGSHCILCCFFFSYHGYKLYNFLGSETDGLFESGIVFFPTSATNIKGDMVSTLQYISAAIFFVILSCLSIFHLTESYGNKNPKKRIGMAFIECEESLCLFLWLVFR